MSALELVAQRLRTLEDGEGRLEPERVVEEARDPKSPLHPFFEWDDTSAAHAHRLSQARGLIRRLKIEVIVRDVPMDVVKYVRDPDEATAYANIAVVRSREETARKVIVDEMGRVAKHAKRARQVAAFLGATADVDEITRIAESIIGRTSITDPTVGEA
jgi:hypothetical protein